MPISGRPMNPSSPSPENQPERKSIYRPARETAERSFLHKFTDTPQGTSESGSFNRSRPRNPGGPSGWFLIFFLLATALPLAAITFFVGKTLGSEEGYTKARNEYFHSSAPNQTVNLPKDRVNELVAAIKTFRTGSPEASTAALQKLLEEFPQVGSVNYALALSKIPTGEFNSAVPYLEKSISLGHRISDARALLAHIEIQVAASNPNQTFSDPNIRARGYLESAIEADPLNPAPYIELANMNRRLRDSAAAIQNLESARALLFPVDTILVSEIVLSLLRDQDGQLPTDAKVHPFVQAVRSAREGDTLTAARLFAECRVYLPEETFAYLASDPAVRQFGEIPELKNVLASK